METCEERDYQEVIRQATQCAMVCRMHGTGNQAECNSESVTRVVDMATTGEIPEGYTHLIFVAIGQTGYVVSRNLEERYKVEICDQIVI